MKLQQSLLLGAGCLLAFSGAHAASYSDTIMAQGPIAYYRFNDGVLPPTPMPPDLATNLGNLGPTGDGVYTNAFTRPVAGAIAGNSAVAFSNPTLGTAYFGSVRIPNNAALNPASSGFSVEFWAKPSNNTAALLSPLNSMSFAPGRAGYLFYQNGATWQLRIGVTTSTTASIINGGTVVPNAWHHIVGVYSGGPSGTMTLFVNGVQVATGPATYEPNLVAPFSIGATSVPSREFDGAVDEVAFFDVPLSAEQIAAHYAAGTGGDQATAYPAAVLGDEPVGYWRLDEPAPAVIPVPVAANSGSLGASANGTYRGGAFDSTEAPNAPAFIGFEEDNTAAEFNGSSAYVTTIAGLMNNLPRFTLSGWIRRGADQANRTGLFGQNDIVEFGYINNNTLECWTDNGLDIPNPFPNAEWEHVAIVQEGSPGTLTMYTNGLPAGSRQSTLPANNSFAFNIGGGGVFDGAGNFFNGQIDEVALFNKALTPAQICDQFYNAVAGPPKLTQDLPLTSTFFEGDPISLCVGVCGTPFFTYKWYYFGTQLPDQSGPCLDIPDAAPADSGAYYVEISNDYGMIASGSCDVTVQPIAPPVITQGPSSLTRYAGGSATFTVVATGGSRVTYQWTHDEVDIPGATNAMLTLTDLEAGDAGNYEVVVTNPADSTRASATLTVLTPAPGSYEEVVVNNNPRAYWRLNESSGTVAHDYAGGNDGTYNNVTLGVPGGLFDDADLAAGFDGTSSSVTTVPGLLNGMSKFTIAGWIQRGADQANRTGIFGQNDLVEFGYINNNTLECWTDNGLDISPNPIGNGVWAHVAIVSDGSPGTLTMYTNGLPAGSRSHTLPGPNNFSFNIGGGGVFDASGNFFNGAIDEISLYDKALPAEVICEMYLVGSGTPFSLAISKGGNFLADSKPAGTPHSGVNRGAEWQAENTDGTPVTRDGVMNFVAAEGDQIIVPANADFDSTSGTISFYVRSAGNVGAGNEGAILFDRRTDRGDVIALLNDGRIFVQAVGAGLGVVNSFSSTATVNDDRWHHVAYVYDQSAGGSIALYIDGVAAGSQANAAAWSWPTAQQIELGRSHDGYWYLLNGAMDDFQIYNRMLNAGEVATLAAGSVVDAAALMVRLNFDGPPSGLQITWPCGVLQWTDSLQGNGPGTVWMDVPGARSPLNIEGSAPSGFYRVRR